MLQNSHCSGLSLFAHASIQTNPKSQPKTRVGEYSLKQHSEGEEKKDDSSVDQEQQQPKQSNKNAGEDEEEGEDMRPPAKKKSRKSQNEK